MGLVLQGKYEWCSQLAIHAIGYNIIDKPVTQCFVVLFSANSMGPNRRRVVRHWELPGFVTSPRDSSESDGASCWFCSAWALGLSSSPSVIRQVVHGLGHRIHFSTGLGMKAWLHDDADTGFGPDWHIIASI